MLRRAWAVCILSWLVCALVVPTVAADGRPDAACERNDRVSGACQVWIPVGGSSGSSGVSGTARLCVNSVGSPIACDNGWGVWSNSLQCYLKVLDPQPPRDDPAWADVWRGRLTGKVFLCAMGGVSEGMNVWLETIERPQPVELARRAMARLDLSAVRVGMVPLSLEENPRAMGVVGYPVWMWVASPDASTMGPKSITVSDGQYSVSLSAKVGKVVWDMGDGSQVTCVGAGTPWTEQVATRAESPDCGYVYERQGSYRVRATSYWSVEWSAMGESGQISFTLSREVHNLIGELQVVTRR